MKKRKNSVFKEKFSPDQQRIAAPIISAGIFTFGFFIAYCTKQISEILNTNQPDTLTEEIIKIQEPTIEKDTTNFLDYQPKP